MSALNTSGTKKQKCDQSLQSIRYHNGCLEILDQLLLPDETVYIKVPNTSVGWNAIRNMQVRGAPAIAIVGCLSLASEIYQREFESLPQLISLVQSKLDFLVTSRPTAVNMADAAIKLKKIIEAFAEQGLNWKQAKDKLLCVLENMLSDDIAANHKIGSYGGQHILQLCKAPVRVLTHCNTGSLATGGYGTALGVVRYIFEQNQLDHAYCTETRPYNQGARLTAYEFVFEKIPATLICDSTASMLMKEKAVSAVVVGADRIVANGDTANKIGTYQLAIAAKYHNIPFYVCAPTTTCDMSKKCGAEITIEERSPAEMTQIRGNNISAAGINCWNPAFDVTPASLITGGIVTEFGVVPPTELESRMAMWIEHITF